ILYEEFIDITYLAEGGFGKVFKAIWKLNSKEAKDVVLKYIPDSKRFTIKDVCIFKAYYTLIVFHDMIDNAVVDDIN
ncbi:18094_t:CDS:1, partial [Dentiscutata erythropus]